MYDLPEDKLWPLFEYLCIRYGVNPNQNTETFQEMKSLILLQAKRIEELEASILQVSNKYSETQESILTVLYGKDPDREIIPDYISDEINNES